VSFTLPMDSYPAGMNVRPILMLLVATAAASLCRGQLIGPIPPATPPTPPYVPADKTEPPVVTPPEVEPPAPSIVARDEQGRLKPLAGTAEETAVAAYSSFDAPRREKIAASAAARKLDLDRFVITNLDKVLAAKQMQEKVQTESEFGKLFAARDLTVSLRFERLIDRLERDQAITAAQRVRLDETLLAYDRARKQEIEKETGGDPTRTGVLNLRQTFADATREPLESLERQMHDIVEHFSNVKDQLKLRPEQSDECARIEKEPAPIAASHLDRFVREKLDLEQQRAAMTARLAARAPKP
jgi:hypothetical protein